MPMDVEDSRGRPVLFMGRRIKPVAFGLAVACASFAWSAITDTGVLDGTLWSDIVGALGVTTAVLLTVAWWRGSQRLAEWGLLAVAFIYAIRIWFILLTVGFAEGLWLSIGTFIVASGSFILERRLPPLRED